MGQAGSGGHWHCCKRAWKKGAAAAGASRLTPTPTPTQTPTPTRQTATAVGARPWRRAREGSLHFGPPAQPPPRPCPRPRPRPCPCPCPCARQPGGPPPRAPQHRPMDHRHRGAAGHVPRRLPAQRSRAGRWSGATTETVTVAVVAPHLATPDPLPLPLPLPEPEPVPDGTADGTA